MTAYALGGGGTNHLLVDDVGIAPNIPENQVTRLLVCVCVWGRWGGGGGGINQQQQHVWVVCVWMDLVSAESGHLQNPPKLPASVLLPLTH